MEEKRDKNGYLTYETNDGKRRTIHSRVAKEKYGYDKIPEGFVIHHIDFNKDNNKKSNLMILHKKEHTKIHRFRTLEIKYFPKKKKKVPEKD